LADKATQLILGALSRAVLDPDGTPLHGSKTAPGLFATTAPAKQAAQVCKMAGYVQVIGTQGRGKSVQEVCTITEKGLEYLLDEADPRHVLEDFVRVLEARQDQVNELIAGARKTQTSLEALRAIAERVLQQIAAQHGASPGTGPATGPDAALQETTMLSGLAQWHAAGASEDCPLPALFRHVQQFDPGMTIGQFHDGLRQLHAQERIYLHPWTGPLYDMPEPAYALLSGHEIVYYVSLR
jgi:hypothetical protein